MAAAAAERTIRATLMAVLVLPLLLSGPSTAIAAATQLASPIAATKNAQDVAALFPPASALEASSDVDEQDRGVQGRIAEAKAILQELRDFANTAKYAVDLGNRLKVLRLANQRLKRDIEKEKVASKAHRQHTHPDQADTANKVRIIVDNWLAATRLKHVNRLRRERLAAAELAWRQTESRAILLRELAAELRADVQALRAERAALAVELGRTRRQITAVTTETRSSERDRLTIEARTMALRNNISSGLRTILTGEATR